MPRIRCHYNQCVFNDELFCSAAEVEIDPTTGCATYSIGDGAPVSKENWDDEEQDEPEEWEEEDDEDEDDEQDDEAY